MSSATVGLIKPPIVGMGVAPVAPSPEMGGPMKKKRRKPITGKPSPGMKPGVRGGSKPMVGKPMSKPVSKDPMSEITGGMKPVKKEKEVY